MPMRASCSLWSSVSGSALLKAHLPGGVPTLPRPDIRPTCSGSAVQKAVHETLTIFALGVVERYLSQSSNLNAPAIVFDCLLDGVVLLGKPHQLQADGVHQSVPTCNYDVVRYAYRRPALAVVGPLDEDAHLGGGTLARLEHAHLVIGQTNVGHARVYG